MIVELCEHGEAKPHRFVVDPGPYTWRDADCPGGRVLQQAIIIERDGDGNWPDWLRVAWKHAGDYKDFVDEILASVQETR